MTSGGCARRRSLCVALLSMTLSASAPAATDWAQRDLLDPRSGDAVNAPAGHNDKGFKLELLSEGSGEVLAIFRLPPGDRDFLDATKAPLLSLDGGPQQSVLLLEGGLTWAAFPVWNGRGNAGAGLLRDLMQGTTVEVTYFLDGGGYKTTVFDLEGAALLLAQGFGIPERLSAEEIATARELETAIEQEGARCLERKGKKRERCLEAARDCIEQAATAEQLRECFASSGG